MTYKIVTVFISLKDIFIESGIISKGSINGVLSGKHYNRSIRCHKLMYEAMQRLQVEAFQESLDEVERVNTVDFILCMSESFPDDPFHEYVKCSVF